MSKFKVGDKVVIGAILNCSCVFCKQLEGEILKIDEISYVGAYNAHYLLFNMSSNRIQGSIEILDTYCKLFIDDVGLVCKNKLK